LLQSSSFGVRKIRSALDEIRCRKKGDYQKKNA
jgi:hypothetical protein